MYQDILWSKIWSILQNVPYALEKKIHKFCYCWWSILHMSVRSNCFTVLSSLLFRIDLLSDSSIQYWKWDIEVFYYYGSFSCDSFYYYSRAVCFSIQFCQWLLHIFRKCDVWYIYIYTCYISVVNWPFYCYIVSFFVSCNSFWFKYNLAWY